jgi:hypothetical protein
MSAATHTRRTWAEERAADIERELRGEYGRGFEKLSAAQRSALHAERVLVLVLAQAGEQFAPAQQMARDVLAALATGGAK